jgi:hypothetical protein
MAIANQLGKVIDKTGRLIELCAALQEENDLLKRENESQKQFLMEFDQHSKMLEERVKVLTLARSLEGVQTDELGVNEKTLDIKQKITEFVREIDKCIVLLKR